MWPATMAILVTAGSCHDPVGDCWPESLSVSVDVTGIPEDPDGFRISATGPGGFDRAYSIPREGTFKPVTVVSPAEAGLYEFTLTDVEGNCVAPQSVIARNVSSCNGIGHLATFQVECISLPPVAEVTLSVESVALNDTVAATYIASDDIGLVAATIDWGDGTDLVDLPIGDELSMVGEESHTYATAGFFTVTLETKDTAGNIGRDQALVQVLDRVTLALRFREYFSQAANATGLHVFLQGDSGQPVEIQPDVLGEATVDAARGEYRLFIDDDDNSDLHRALIAGEYLVDDATDRGIPLLLDGPTEVVVETVDSAAILRDMSVQWSPWASDPVARTARVGVPLYFVVYEGNPTCGEAWDPERKELCGDVNRYPPGQLIDQRFREHFGQFLDAQMEILDDPRVGGNPFDIRVVFADTTDILEHVEDWDQDPGPPGSVGYLIRPKPDRLLIYGVSRAPFREYSAASVSDNGTPVTDWAAERVNGGRPFQFSNENRLWGSIAESDPPVCSVRDNELNQHPDCRFDQEDTPIFFERDKQFHMIAAGYLAHAQAQGFAVRLVE